MKQKLLLKSMLLLCALVAGSSSVWATDFVINTTNFTKPNDGSGYAAYDGNHTIDGVTIASSNVMINNSALQFKKSGGNLYNSDEMPGNITKITLATTTGFTIYVGTSSNPSTTTVTSGSAIIGNYKYFKVINNSSSAATTATITVEYSATYTVTYDANGATSGAVPTDNTKYAENATVTVLGNTGSLAKTHYTFGGWNTKDDGTGTTYAASETFSISDNTTLYAKWNANTHDITMPAEDEYGTYTASATDDVPYGTEVTLTYTPKSTYSSYVATWYVNGSKISGNKFNMPDEDVTVTVTVTSPPDYAELPFAWDGGTSEALTALYGVTANGLGTDYAESNAPYRIKFDTTGDYILIKTDDKPGRVTIGVKMLGGSTTSTITVQGSADGSSFNNVEELTISGSTNSVLTLETTKAFAATDRYVKLLFTKGSNVGVGPISISANRTITLNDACTDGTLVYGTYSSSKAFVVPSDLDVSEVSVVDGKLYVDSYNTGDVVPANTGVLVAALTGGNYDVTLSAEAGTSVLGNDNMLKPSGDAGIDADGMSTAASGCKYYRLTMHNGTTLGFYWGAASGAAFALGANKAYLAVPAGSPAPEFFGFGGDVTGIDAVNGSELKVNGEYYNLAGQRVANPTKGLYIVNGKKVVIK